MSVPGVTGENRMVEPSIDLLRALKRETFALKFSKFHAASSVAHCRVENQPTWESLCTKLGETLAGVRKIFF